MGRHSAAPRHARPKSRKAVTRYRAAFAAAAVAGGTMLSTIPAPAADAAGTPLGNRILNIAETRTGDWYSYGSAGPAAFDCSGLVYWAARQAGVANMPRTTYGMLSAAVSAGILRRTGYPQRGDLAFYGSGHVEFVTVWYHTTFGAQNWGTRVGWHRWSAWWHPTEFFTWTGRL